MKKTTVIIPARKGSTRISNKNRQLINDESLLLRKVRQCLSIPDVKVVVSTDDEEFKEPTETLGAVFYRQPDEFCIGNNPSGMIKDVLANIESTRQILWAHPTNPFIDTQCYMDALEVMVNKRKEGYDSLFSVKEMKGHFWNDLPSPINFGSYKPRHILANDLRPMFAQDGGIFIRPYEDMLEDGKFVGGNAVMHTLDELIGWDIDYPWQLEFAQWRAFRA